MLVRFPLFKFFYGIIYFPNLTLTLYKGSTVCDYKQFQIYNIYLTIAITGNLQICEQQTTINNYRLLWPVSSNVKDFLGSFSVVKS